VELNDRDLALVLVVFELRITSLESDVTCAQIDDLAEKLTGIAGQCSSGHRHLTDDDCTPPCGDTGCSPFLILHGEVGAGAAAQVVVTEAVVHLCRWL
jgi:hypothetical protein